MLVRESGNRLANMERRISPEFHMEPCGFWGWETIAQIKKAIFQLKKGNIIARITLVEKPKSSDSSSVLKNFIYCPLQQNSFTAQRYWAESPPALRCLLTSCFGWKCQIIVQNPCSRSTFDIHRGLPKTEKIKHCLLF